MSLLSDLNIQFRFAQFLFGFMVPTPKPKRVLEKNKTLSKGWTVISSLLFLSS